MTPKERRDRLFKKGRPHIRQVQVFDGDKYHKDIGILWVAYQKQPFYSLGPGLTQEQFAKEISEICKTTELLLADDENKAYKNSGPVAVIGVHSNGWKIEPHAEFFKWANPRNILRVSVAFFQMARYRKIGACVVHSLEDSFGLFDKCCEYGVLHKVGTIVNGDPRGDEIVYSVRGKRNVKAD